MTIIHGTIQSTDGRTFQASFVAKDINWSLAGSFDSLVQPFQSRNTTLEYEKLTPGHLSFTGVVGITHVLFIFSDGMKLEGPLDSAISQDSAVSGSADAMLLT
ncbi:hypothetical protein BDZ94DRAFT_510287 [Collybia nuda]|uniref:Uncharacterized protein n=1 Tax=Collybia nuda TaxID=64659 RepID=A0A9P5YAU4_9AGAR|nr:hypothetical protein BDZ94DRAFT_510287 [Collybia nuda]